MKKIIIFGGSFDPVHKGHIEIALDAFKKIKADKLFFVLSYNSPESKIHRASWDDRIKMLKIAIKNYDNFFISEYERQNEGISYTWKTIKYFKDKYNDHKIFLLIGSDQYFNFKNWNNTNYILDNSNIICYERNGYKIGKVENNLIYINEVKSLASSTNLILNPNDLLNKEVIKYINDNSIYSLYRLKKEGLSPKRIKHSIEVAELSKKIAKNFDDIMIKKAYCAGIYHDIAKELKKDKLIKYANELLNYTNYPSWKVIHAPLGEYVLKNKYKINDEDVLSAVFYHSIPRDNPSILEKIIFCADKLSFREDRETNYDLINICINDINEGFNILLKLNQKWIKKE